MKIINKGHLWFEVEGKNNRRYSVSYNYGGGYCCCVWNGK